MLRADELYLEVRVGVRVRVLRCRRCYGMTSTVLVQSESVLCISLMG